VVPDTRAGRRIALISMAISGSLAVAKIAIGWMAGSTSVIADGVESAGDVLASGFLLVGLWVAARPPDDDHPYGHGRFETLTALGLGIVLAVIGVAISFRSLQSIGDTHAPPKLYAIWPLIASIVLKAGLANVKMRTGKRIGSSALVADAWNDAVDILSGVAALVAVGMTIYDPGRFLYADHFGGFAVGLIVVFLGLQVIRENTLTLMDTMPEPERLEEIRRVSLLVPGALGVEKCFARKTGLRYHVDLHLEVDPQMTVREGHDIATEVRIRCKETLRWVADVLVHVEPYPGNDRN
jgi:cation diffusion facilitator family transporter